MNSFIMAAEVVLPLIVYMSVGVLIQRRKIMSKEYFKVLNNMIFKVLIPLTLFFNVYEVDLAKSIQPDVFVFVFVSIILVFLITWLFVGKTVPKKEDASTMIQGIFRSNFVLFGIVIAQSVCDDEGVGLVAALAAMAVPLFNILSVILFEVKCGGKVELFKLVKNIFKNPLVAAGLLGCACNLAGLPIPELLSVPLKKLGDIATPLALVTLGGMLSLGSMMRHWKYLAAATVSRLVVVPVLMVGTAILLGMRGNNLIVILAIFAPPTAVASAPMAQAMGGNGELAGEIVAVTSVCCIITIFLFVFGLSGFGYI